MLNLRESYKVMQIYVPLNLEMRDGWSFLPFVFNLMRINMKPYLLKIRKNWRGAIDIVSMSTVTYP
jgi:hypothetical protein